MKKILALLLILCLALVGCAQKAEAPQDTLDTFLTHMQKGEYEQADAYVANAEEEKLAEDLNAFDQKSDFIRIMRSFEYELGEPDIKEDAATIPIKASYPNMVPVFSSAMNEMTASIFSDPTLQALTDEQMTQKVNDMLNKYVKEQEASLEKKEAEFAITLKKSGEKWLVDIDNEEFVLMLTGHIFTSVAK